MDGTYGREGLGKTWDKVLKGNLKMSLTKTTKHTEIFVTLFVLNTCPPQQNSYPKTMLITPTSLLFPPPHTFVPRPLLDNLYWCVYIPMTQPFGKAHRISTRSTKNKYWGRF